jgi:hypothetical protein
MIFPMILPWIISARWGRRTREWVATDKILFMNDDAVMKFNSDEILTSSLVCNMGMPLAVFLTLGEAEFTYKAEFPLDVCYYSVMDETSNELV